MKHASGVTLVLTFLTASCGVERNDSGEIASAGSVDAFEIRVGDCFNDDPDPEANAEVFDVRGVPCAEPHDNEAYATFDLTETTWPGEDQVYELGHDGCLERFEDYVGATYEESIIDFYPMLPTEGSWAQRNDRGVVCVAYHMELGKLTGSVRESGM